ncbi:MAG TPA: zinc ribbon domain-containing protein [bacterium]|nr:zinc ribbon domain-containing protein [bacterium]
MKCARCGNKNEPSSKFCKECGAELQANGQAAPITSVSELYGKEVEVLFFIENFTGKVTGIVNPTEDQIGRYREAVLQKIIIEVPMALENDENIGAILTFIRQSKEYLGEKFNEGQYRNFSPADLKKEYLKLFERILKDKSRKGSDKPLPAANTEKAK